VDGECLYMGNKIVFIDTEVSIQDKKIYDAGACTYDGNRIHTSKVFDFYNFIKDADFLCGHNIYNHDLKYIPSWTGQKINSKIIDTLYLSPLLYPKTPYHRLVKDDKLQVDELNNPLNDALHAQELFADELNDYKRLSYEMQRIFCALLYDAPQFRGFFEYIHYVPYSSNLDEYIKKAFKDKICSSVDINKLIAEYPVELAYALALINVDDNQSITPKWIMINYPMVSYVMKLLRDSNCGDSNCIYCKEHFDVVRGLQRIFKYPAFRTFNGEPLQENAAKAAMAGKSLLAIFPTGGGKSITFQLPALMAGENIKGLTIVISPLQSLMKDQVDNLNDKGIVNAVTLNGMQNPLERKNSIERVKNGMASLLYISPESLRSKTIENLILGRNIVRVVIDEAHCFSSWGQDFRVDYLFIADFIKTIQQKKGMKTNIPVSCFTATAKQKVISDICDYFRNNLGVELELYTSSATRENLHYSVIFQETDSEKYSTLRNIISEKNCPTIVYVSRTKRAAQIAEKLSDDGIAALPFYGKMEIEEKISNQERFMKNEVQVMVATSAFGMGVDKSDVGLVIHYDISDSLENYIQEAGRAGRDQSLQAECYVLYNNDDLDKHFILLNQTKLTIAEIQQVWRAVKELSKNRSFITCSALEIARQAGWEDSSEIETRVRTAIAALEQAGYIKRHMNVPHVYATSINVPSMSAVDKMLKDGIVVSKANNEYARKILSYLIGSRSKAGNSEGESRIDYLADITGLEKGTVISVITELRQAGILSDENDMNAFIYEGDSSKKSTAILNRFIHLEQFLLEKFSDDGFLIAIKEANDEAINRNIKSSPKDIKNILYYYSIKKIIERKYIDEENSLLVPYDTTVAKIKQNAVQRNNICEFIINALFEKKEADNHKEKISVEFSVVDLYKKYKERDISSAKTELSDIEDALLYLDKIGAMKIEGGFLVLYNGMQIERIEHNNAIQYKKEDYKNLENYYQQRIQQIHIVGKYANLMVKDYNQALDFVKNYFGMEYQQFIKRYFVGEEAKEINRNITPAKYKLLFDKLSETQRHIIDDDSSQYIVVAAGPGSGKTMLLVHKLASLLMLEDVKHEQLLMLTFSRAAAIEFRKRLNDLIGNAAKRIEIKTFHSYCFDLLGKIGRLEDSSDIVHDATEFINSGEVEPEKITKKVVVIDEAQDMDANEYALVKSIIEHNDDLRIIAVGDDDQNIYAFRGSDSSYMKSFISEYGAVKYELPDNYRSCKTIIEFTNSYVSAIQNRMKSHEINAINKNAGLVTLVHHTTRSIEQALVNDIEKEYNNVCNIGVLTWKNDESLTILGMLQQKGIPAKLVQSLDGFNLSNLIEIRYFINTIESKCISPIISDAVWNDAVNRFSEKYKHSSNLSICLRMFDVFDETYSVRYKSDLHAFFEESNLEDFYEDKKGVVTVSTIHKSKGREYDRVYIMIDNMQITEDDQRRAIYVALTRAKERLNVHYSGNVFDNVDCSSIEKKEDSKIYDGSKEVVLQLSYRDVYLNSFIKYQSSIYKLISGQQIYIDSESLCLSNENRKITIGKLSNLGKNKIEHFNELGYTQIKAVIRFIVYWKGENMDKEIQIVLPDIYFEKRN